MGRLEELHTVTLELLHVLETRQDNEREKTIQHIDQLIGKRDEIIETIKAPYTNEEEKLGEQILQLNERIMQEMNQLYAIVKKDMKKVKQQKERNRSYINPYGPMKTIDGMYVDRKQ